MRPDETRDAIERTFSFRKNYFCSQVIHDSCTFSGSFHKSLCKTSDFFLINGFKLGRIDIMTQLWLEEDDDDTFRVISFYGDCFRELDCKIVDFLPFKVSH
jgi:hypothetical protein